MIKYDYSKLKEKIKEIYGNKAGFADAMEMTENTLDNILNNQNDFSIGEIEKAIELLEITSANDAQKLFFAQKVE